MCWGISTTTINFNPRTQVGKLLIFIYKCLCIPFNYIFIVSLLNFENINKLGFNVAQALRSYHHLRALEGVIPSFPSKPHNTLKMKKIHYKMFTFYIQISVGITLSRSEILRIGKVEAIMTSATRLPPPASF